MCDYYVSVCVRTVSVCRQRQSSADGRVQLDDTLGKETILEQGGEASKTPVSLTRYI